MSRRTLINLVFFNAVFALMLFWAINNIVLGVAKVVAYFDRNVVNDTGVNGPGQVAQALGFALKLQQTGKLPNYALAMVLGVAVFAIAAFTVRG